MHAEMYVEPATAWICGGALGAINQTLEVSWHALLVVGLVAFLPPAIIGTVYGWIAVRRIRASFGELRGMGVAVGEALLYPFIAAGCGSFLLWYCIIVAYYDGPDVPNRGRAVHVIGSSLTAIVAFVVLGWVLNRVTAPSAIVERISPPRVDSQTTRQ